MSFQNKSFWMPRDTGCLIDEQTNYDNSPSIEPKRPHQWLMDGPEIEIYSNKRQEMEAVSSRPRSGIPNGSISPGDNSSLFQTVSGQFSERLFGSELERTSNIIDRSIPTADMGNLNAELKGFEDQLKIHSSGNWSMLHTILESSLGINYGGIRRVKVKQVGPSENSLPLSIGHPYSRGDNYLSVGAAYIKPDNNISLCPTINKGKETAISMEPSFTNPNDNFVSMGHTFNRGDGSFMLMGHYICKSYDNSLSMGQPFDKGDVSFVSKGQGYGKGDANIISSGHVYNKGHENFTSMPSTYNKDNGSFSSVGLCDGKGAENSKSILQISVAASTYVIPRGTNDGKGNSGNLSMGENYQKGETETGTNVFGDFQKEHETNLSGRMTSGYDLTGNQFSVLTSKAPGLKIVAENKIVARAASTERPKATKKTKAARKSKEPKSPKAKKAPNNNFLFDVKSLLLTGILDGVPVKYVSWLREYSVRGIVKGTGYLCGCKDCKFSKSLNAYELEGHAGCKATKHPNNRIYFQNGKTIYMAVQELKNTSHDKLFDAIQTVTGSPIHLKNFSMWKASYEAANRELQRIYGKEKLAETS